MHTRMKPQLAAIVISAVISACAGTPSADAPSNTPPVAASSTPATTPAGPRITLKDAFTLGHRTAPLALVVYADYQCPYCARFHHGMLGDIKARYVDSGVLLYVHKDFPLRMHPQALPAAIAARCAGAQGRYGQMQGRLYEAQTNLGEPLYTQLATTIGLDLAAFQTCRADPATHRSVERDLREGQRANVTATPTLLLGRIEGDSVIIERVSAGLPSLDALGAEIERLRASPSR